MLGQARLETLVFLVSTLDRSIAFYRDVLGLAVELIDSHDGPIATAQAGAVSLVFIPQPARIGDSPIPVFSIDDGIDDCLDALVAKGVEIVTPVSDAPDGGLTFDFLDPDRNVLSVHQSGQAPRRR